VSGKFFYWGSSGGMSLYWMSTSYSADELGSWFSADDVNVFPQLAPHREFFAQINGLSELARDDAYKRKAIENISHDPKIFVVNWAANIGRLVFQYPFSLINQKLSTYFYLLPNMFLVVAFIFGLYPAFIRRRAIPFEITALLLFGAITFGGASLLSAFNRQFHPVVPVLILWNAFIYFRILKIELRSNLETI